MELVQRESVELHAALYHLQESPYQDGESALALWLANASSFYQGLLTDARSISNEALLRTPPATMRRIELLLWRSVIEWNSGQAARSAPYAAAALEDARALGDDSLLAASLATINPKTRIEGVHFLAEGRALLDSLPVSGTYWSICRVERFWAGVTMRYVDPDWADSITRKFWLSSRESGHPIAGLNLGSILLGRGQLAEAERLLAPLEHLSEDDPAQIKVLGLFQAAVMRIAKGEIDIAVRDLDRVENYLRQVDMPGAVLGVTVVRSVVNRMLGDRSAATVALSGLVNNVTYEEPNTIAEAEYLLAVLARESSDQSAAADHLRRAWFLVAGLDAQFLDLILECLLERALQIIATDPEEATRLIGLVNANQGDFIFLHGVDYDTDAMLAELRATLGDDEVGRILSLAATQELPDSPTWLDPSASLRIAE